MSVITTALLSHEPDLQRFSCGVESIDKMVENAYLDHLLRKTMTYQIAFRGLEIGYYQLSFQNIYLADTNVPFSDQGNGEDFYGVLSINFLAIKEDAQHIGIGTNVLRLIIQQAIELSKEWPIRVIYIEAFADKVEWYEWIGFQRLRDVEVTDRFGLIPMFFELMTNREKQAFEDYCNLILE